MIPGRYGSNPYLTDLQVIEPTVDGVEIVLEQFRGQAAAYAEELTALEQPPTGPPAYGHTAALLLNERRADDLRGALDALQKRGIDPNEPLDSALVDLYRYGRRLGLKRPSIVALERLRAELLAQQPAVDTAPWPRQFRYRGVYGKFGQQGRYVKPGELVWLTEAQAKNFADTFEPPKKLWDLIDPACIAADAAALRAQADAVEAAEAAEAAEATPPASS